MPYAQFDRGPGAFRRFFTRLTNLLQHGDTHCNAVSSRCLEAS